MDWFLYGKDLSHEELIIFSFWTSIGKLFWNYRKKIKKHD